MKKIYKYLNLHDGLLTVENNSVALNNPYYFNDPYDSSIDYTEREFEKAVEVISDYYITKQWLEILSNPNIKKPKFLKPFVNYRILQINKSLEKSKRNKRFYSLSYIRGLTWIALSKNDVQINAGKTEFNEGIMKRAEVLRKETVLASCFSKVNDSILMWSHYADKHTGVCIEFERPCNDFIDVKYNNKRNLLYLSELVRKSLGYELCNEKINSKDKTVIDIVLKPFIYKAKSWKYEKEVRCLLSKESNNVSYNEQCKKYLYKMPYKIKRIYLGCKIDKTCEDYINLMNLAKNNEIEVAQFDISKRKFELLEQD